VAGGPPVGRLRDEHLQHKQLQHEYWPLEHWQQEHWQDEQRLTALDLPVEPGFLIGAGRAAAVLVDSQDGAGGSLPLQPGFQRCRRGVISTGMGVAEDHGDPEKLLAVLQATEQKAADLRDQLKAIQAEALLR
jgi:hypothetical protein